MQARHTWYHTHFSSSRWVGCQSFLAVSLWICFIFSKGVKITRTPPYTAPVRTYVFFSVTISSWIVWVRCSLSVCVCVCVVSNPALLEYKGSASCMCHGSPVVFWNRKRKRMDWFIVQLTERWRKEGGICFDVLVFRDLPWIFVLLFPLSKVFFFFFFNWLRWDNIL